MIAISQSGASKATRDALEACRKQNAKIVSITASGNTLMAKESDLSIELPGGREKALPKTRVYTAGSIQLLRIAYEVAKTQEPLTPSPFPNPEDLRKAMEQVLAQSRTVVDQVVEAWGKYEMFTFIGGGAAWIAACEAALKMRENNYTFSEGYEVEEFAHGRTCSFMPDRPLIAYLLRGPSIDRTNDVINNALDLHVPTLAIVEDGIETVPAVDYKISVPCMPSEFTAAIVATMPMQLFSHQFTLARDIDPDSIRTDQPEFNLSHHKWIFPPGTH